MHAGLVLNFGIGNGGGKHRHDDPHDQKAKPDDEEPLHRCLGLDQIFAKRLCNNRPMLLSLCFFFVSGLCWLIMKTIFGCPGILRGPWTPERLTDLKRVEQWAYLGVVFLIPFASIALRRLIGKPTPVQSVEEDRSPRWGRRSLGLLLGALAVLYCSVPQLPLSAPIEHMDEGLRLAVAFELDHGKALYKDIFLNYGPLYEAVQTKVGFALFGEGLLGLRKMDRMIAPTGYLMVFLLAFAALRYRWLLLFLFFVLTSRVSLWISPRSALPLLSLFLLVLSWNDVPSRVRIFLELGSGAAIALAFLYSSETGMLGIITLAAFYFFLFVGAVVRKTPVKSLLEEMTFVVGGAALVAGPWFLWLLFTGRLGLFFENIYFTAATHVTVGAKPTPVLCEPLTRFISNPLSLFTPDGATMRLWVPPLLYTGVLTKTLWDLLWGWWDRSGKIFLLITLCGVFFFLISLGRWDIDHWLKATAAFWVLSFLVIDANLSAVKRLWRRSHAFVLAPLLLIFFLGRYLMLYVFPSRLPSIWMANAALFQTTEPNQEDAEMIEAISQRVHRLVPEDGRMFVFNNHASFYFLTNRQNATPYSLESYILLPVIIERAMASLLTSQPSLIIAVEDGEGFQYRPLQKRLAEFIRSRYVPVDRTHGFVFMVPRGALSSSPSEGNHHNSARSSRDRNDERRIPTR